jgi:hypothetical protein
MIRALLVLLCLACWPRAAAAEGHRTLAELEQSELAEMEREGAIAPRPLYASEVRNHYYRVLARSPTKAFLWELALPGAGHIYNGFPIQAAVAIGLTVAGAGMWIGGAITDNDGWWWAGMATFSAGRVYGLISAPVTAVLLNAAYRRQFGISGRF